MPTVAEQLRHARERQQLDVYQVAEITKIKTDHIRALESGDYSAFSAPVYVRGFVRTYAQVLKLDVPGLAAQLESELNQTERFREFTPLSGKGKGPLDSLMLHLSRMNWAMAVAVTVVALSIVLVVTGVRHWTDRPADDPLRRLGPGLYQPTNEPGDLLPLPSS